MALFYQSGRVSRFAVGVPGFSTNRDLVLDVDGAIGIDTSEPRGSIDTPEISIRGDIIDSRQETGGLGYFLTQDSEGVRWVAASPIDLTYIRVFENDVQEPGLSSATGLNFKSLDDYFLEVDQNPTDPNLADIKLNNPWIKIGYPNNRNGKLNFGLSTSFGPDGTFWSLPGYGTSEVSGITSIGIGTNNPQADLQVGIGSTGVQIYGEEGRLEAETIKAKNLELDGNLSAESLVIDPGISTFRGNIDAQGLSSFSGDVSAGVVTIRELTVRDFDGTNVITGFTTLGVGIGSETYTTVDNNLQVNGISTFGDISNPKVGLATFAGDVYVGNDLFVGGEQFVDQLNANNARITGIATINEIDGNLGIFTGLTIGIATIGEVGFNTGIGTALSVKRGEIGLATITAADIGVSTIGFASIGDANVTGVASIKSADIELSQVGILTVEKGLVSQGFSTFVGFATFGDDIYVAGFGTFGEGVDIPFVQVEDLIVSGIATINQLEFKTGIGSTATIYNLVSGIGTFDNVDTDNIDADSGNIGGVDFEGGGDISGEDLEFKTGRIGILTGDTLEYNIGIITYLSAGVGTISTISGTNLSYSDFSTINGVSFANTEVTVQQTLKVIDQNQFGIELGDVTDPRTGLTTVAGDLYVGNDLYVFGTQFIKNLISENLLVTGIGTINELKYAVGFGTTATIDNLQAGLGTITNLISTASTITELDAQTVAVSTDPNKYPTVPGQIFADSTFFEFNVAENSLVSVAQTIGFSGSTAGRLDLNGQLEVAGISSFRDDVTIEADLEVTGLTTTKDLYVSGIATINELDVTVADVDEINAGIATIGDLTVTGVTTFKGDVTIEDIIFINQEVTGVSTVTNQVITGITTINEAGIGFATVGVATVGLLSVTDVEASIIDAEFTNTGVATVGVLSVTESTSITGPTTITGITSVFGDMVIDGDLTVTGIATYAQLDAEQAQIGILTVKTLLDANGFVDAENVFISTSFQSDAGVSTLGFTTIRDSLHIDNNLYVGGITTFAGVVNIDEVEFVELSVTGVATIGELNFGVGIGTTLSVGVATASSLTVTGPSTFVGVGTFQDDLYVSEDLYVERNVLVGSALTVPELTVTSLVNVSGAATISEASIGVATIGFASITNEIVGTSTVGFLSVTDASLSGIVTFTGDIDINADVDIDGFLRVNDLTVTGVTTLNVADIVDAEIDVAEITDATISTSRIGFSSVGIITVGYGNTEDGSFFRTGVGTIVGFTTITGDLFVDGNVTVTGVSSYAQLDADQSRIGILTVNKYLDADFIGSGPIGFATFNDISVNSGVFTSIGATNVNVSGVLTATELEVTDLDVKRNLVVGGITTLGGIGATGITTTRGDLYVGGDLFVKDDIFYDEISGRNLDISGVGTINNLFVNSGIVTTLLVDDLDVNNGFATVFTATAATFTDAKAGIITVTDRLVVTGISTFAGIVTFVENVSFLKDVKIDNELVVDGPTNGSDLFLSGSLAAIGASIRKAQFDEILSGVTTTDYLSVGFAATIGIVTATDAYVDNLYVGIVQSEEIQNTGIITTVDLTVYEETILQELTVNGEVGINSTVTVNGEVEILADVDISGIITSLGADIQGDLLVSGVTTTGSLEVDGGYFYASGLSTFNDGLTVNNELNVDTIRANLGFVTTISGTELTYDIVGINTTLTVTGQSEFIGIASFSNIDVDVTANINTLNVSGLASISSADIDILYANDLTYNIGVGTDLTLATAGVGTATINEANITQANIGIASISGQLNYNDVVSTDAARVITATTSDSLLFTLGAGFRSVEFTVTADTLTDIESVKIHATRFGSNVFFNEYSVVGSGPSLGTYNVVDNAGSTELRVVPPTSDSIRYTIYVVAHS